MAIRATTVIRTGLLASVACVYATAAYAQDSAPADQDQVTAADIIVTAQNRKESVQDVPIAISVVSGEKLQEAGVTDLRELDRVSSAVQITQDQQNTYVAVRGVGTASNNETQDTSVTINIDGEYINRTTVLNAALFDIDRVEVLRGPQGTLYGRNATGGAVNFITRKPGDKFAANGSISYGNYNQLIINGGVDLPVSDTFAVRLSGIYSYRGTGYTYHPNIAALRANSPFPANTPFQPNFSDRSGTQDMKGGRASLRWEPTEGLRVDAAVEYVDSHSILENYRFVDLNAAGNGPGPGCSANGYVEVAPLVPGVQCIPQNTNFFQGVDRQSYDAPTTGVGFQDLQSFAARGRIAYDVGAATITYIGGYRSTKSIERPTLPPGYQFLDFGSKIQTQSHELRINGGTDGGFLYQVGAFYYREETNQERGLYSPFIGAPPVQGSYITYFRRSPVVSQNWSVFGQVDIPLTDQLTAQAGIRYNKGNRHARFENYNFSFNVGPNPLTSAPAQTLNLSQAEDNVSWLAGLNYKPNASTLIYAKVSTGFKGGGFDAVGVYGSEKNTAYEAGMKLNFGPGNRHTFNLSGFYYDYRGLQNAVLLDNTKGGQIFNAGKATIYGIEAEWNFQIDRDNRFYGSFNYLHSRFDDLLAAYAVICASGCSDASIGDLDPVTPGVQQPNLAGNTPPQSPKVVITAGYDHIFRLGGGGSVTASVFTRFKSSYFLTIFNERDLQQKSFTQTDFTLTYRPENERFSVAGFVQNIENVRPAVFGAFVAAGNDRVLNVGYSRPRTYGARVTFEF